MWFCHKDQLDNEIKNKSFNCQWDKLFICNLVFSATVQPHYNIQMFQKYFYVTYSSALKQASEIVGLHGMALFVSLWPVTSTHLIRLYFLAIFFLLLWTHSNLKPKEESLRGAYSVKVPHAQKYLAPLRFRGNEWRTQRKALAADWKVAYLAERWGLTAKIRQQPDNELIGLYWSAAQSHLTLHWAFFPTKYQQDICPCVTYTVKIKV